MISGRPLSRLAVATLVAVAACFPGRARVGPPVPVAGLDATYWVYVGAESADRIYRVRFSPDGAEVEKATAIGELPTEMEGPHGLAVSADKRHLYMTTAHGIPDGKLWKFAAGPDTLVAAPTLLGRFPATVDLTPDGLYAFVVNFNLHGDMVPSSVSVVYTPSMMEVAQTETCTMPHGSRIGPLGLHHYSACMMDDQVVEIDTRSFAVSRRFSVASREEGPLPADAVARRDRHATHEPTCSPTWAQPSASGEHIFVACNASDEILEIDAEEWQLTRRFATGRGPYNIAVTPDGSTLVVTLKQGAAVQAFDLDSGEELGMLSTSTAVTHGVVITPDSRYAFVSSEGIGADPGKVDIFDLPSMTLVQSVDVGQQAGGIAFWKMEPAR